MSELNQQRYSDTAIVFLHIPKAAGSTLNTVINRQYAKDSIFSIYGFERSEREAKTVEQFKTLPETRRSKIKLLRGHVGFGLHDYLPQPSTYITLLRDPAERVVSLYRYIIRRPEHPLYDPVKTNNLSLEEFVRSGIAPSAYNGQTKIIAGFKKGSTEYEDFSIKLLEVAKKNIQEHFAVVGLTEKFDESLLLLQRVLGWKLLFYRRKNVAEQTNKDIPSTTTSLIQKYNELDMELYHFAEKYLENQMNLYGDSLIRDINRFKFLNQQYGQVSLVSRSLLSKMKFF
ncbi:hypothetical protein Glo7428_0228 [Gloeocapsa sp. PCC 7428]|uniref:sulfotransferase family 2 domain-containing protein n=1 Tax=Gloeocapsa sp. PCC 7428 TaxID=1173026 RepID=UPI0002A5FBF2|nr:sulfotransferase family 2 domain-containing protein [Gloeocapsa sp. PCC 7428]AFZ28837.1 hypothetical protein Glo7428_0228 [Gloeocapsa sp. PCC 7428]